MLIAIVVAACFAALIAFYSVLVHNATPEQEDESGIPAPVVVERDDDDLPRAA